MEGGSGQDTLDEEGGDEHAADTEAPKYREGLRLYTCICDCVSACRLWVEKGEMCI